MSSMLILHIVILYKNLMRLLKNHDKIRHDRYFFGVTLSARKMLNLSRCLSQRICLQSFYKSIQLAKKCRVRKIDSNDKNRWTNLRRSHLRELSFGHESDSCIIWGIKSSQWQKWGKTHGSGIVPLFFFSRRGELHKRTDYLTTMETLRYRIYTRSISPPCRRISNRPRATF